MIDAALARAFDATWPAERVVDAGGFRCHVAPGAGRRVNSAHAEGGWAEADIDRVVDIADQNGAAAAFRVMDDQTDLIAALTARGFRADSPTAILTADVAALTHHEIPPVTAFAIWPPLAVQRDLWHAAGIGAARQAVMDRAGVPKAAILGRTDDRAAGTAFVALHERTAMMHALEIVPGLRCRGLAGWMTRAAAGWATTAGADRIGLAVTRGNRAALALYRGLGFTEAGGYAYFIPA